MIYLDSDIAIDWMHGEITREVILAKVGNKEKLAITAPSLYEIYQGIYIMKWSKKMRGKDAEINQEQVAIERLRQVLIEIPWNGNAAQKSAEIYHALAANGESLDVFDCMIAGTIIARGEGKLLTRNITHFKRISELQVISL